MDMIVPKTPPVSAVELVETLLLLLEEDVELLPGLIPPFTLVAGSSPRYLLMVVMTELTCI